MKALRFFIGVTSFQNSPIRPKDIFSLGAVNDMERIEFKVHGEEAWRVPQAIRGYPQKKRVDYDGDGFAVIVTEQYYLRGGCHILTTTIFELIDDNSVKVTLIEGGGREAWVHRGLRVKSTESNKLVQKIEDYCRENGLEIERG